MSGVEMINEIKKNFVDIKIICVSGYSDYEYLRACLRAGANDYILKPIGKIELLNIVKQVVSGDIGKENKSLSQKIDAANAQKNTHYYVEKVIKYIEENYKEHFTLECIAKEMFFNPVYLSHLFKKFTGVRFSEYVNNFRIEKAKELISNSNLRIGEISNLVGYKESRYFSELFKTKTGMSPNEYRNKYGK